MKINLRYYFVALRSVRVLAVSALAFPWIQALAQGSPPATAPLPLPTGYTDINELIGASSQSAFCKILAWIFTVSIILSVVFIFVAAFKYLTSGGSEEKTTSARRTLQWAAVGIVVAILARGVPAIVGSLFPSANSSGLGGICQ